ncbi:unnamed protein product [Lactuca saligna]|uniref:Uncharacterized protein n=1 Tax=Lactuca saligna TaxID=75948 RepID=A0AA36DYI9_LACSI|nr:unnamed protein product [Lactuca saligna]
MVIGDEDIGLSAGFDGKDTRVLCRWLLEVMSSQRHMVSWMALRGNEQSASYGKLVSIGDLNPNVNKKLSAVADILSSKLPIPKSRFFLKIFNSKVTYTTQRHPITYIKF